MIEDDESRLAFFDTDDFAQMVTVKPASADPYDIPAIYDAHLFQANAAFREGMKASGNSPQIRCRSIDLANVAAGRAVIAVDGVDYNLFRKASDGTGMTIAELKIA